MSSYFRFSLWILLFIFLSSTTMDVWAQSGTALCSNGVPVKKVGKQFRAVARTKKTEKLYKLCSDPVISKSSSGVSRDIWKLGGLLLPNCSIRVNKTATVKAGSATTIKFPNYLPKYFATIGSYKLENNPLRGTVKPKPVKLKNYRISIYSPQGTTQGTDSYILGATAKIFGYIPCNIKAFANIQIKGTAPATPTPTPTSTPRTRPEPLNGSFSTQANTSITIDLPVKNPTSTSYCSIIEAPSGGKINVAGPVNSCSVIFIPNNNFVGSTNFRFVVRDGPYRSASIGTIVMNVLASGEFSGIKDSLEPYRQKLTKNEVEHVLRKIAFCGSPDLVHYGLTHSLNDFVAHLLNNLDSTQVDRDAGKIIESLQSQFNAILTIDGEKIPVKVKAPVSDTLLGLQTASLYHARHGNSVRERMAYFLYNQMSSRVSMNLVVRTFVRDYIDSMRRNALGNYSDYIKSQNTLGVVGYFLDNFSNDVRINNPQQDPTGGQLNVNFGRELLELGTIGKMDPITNMPNYTENDVRSSAMAARGLFLKSLPPVSIEYVDANNKVYPGQFAPRIPAFEPLRWAFPARPPAITFFEGTPYQKTAPFKMDGFSAGGDTLTPFLLNTPMAARFISTRLYTTFVNPSPDAVVTAKLAEEILAVNYDLKRFLQKLLTSHMMFHKDALKSGAASPAQTFLCALKRWDLPFPAAAVTNTNGVPVRVSDLIVGGISTAGQPIWAYQTIFGVNEAGKNGAGIVRYGEDLLSPQLLLNRQRYFNSYINLVNTLSTNGKLPFSWSALLPKDQSGNPIMDPAQIIDHLTDRSPLSLEARDKLITYMNTLTIREDGISKDISADWKSTDPEYIENLVNTKIPGALGILFSLIEFNLY